MELGLGERKISVETVSAIFIIILVSLFVLANFVVGFVWPVFILTMLIGFMLAAIYPRSGMLAIVFLTMVWERFFTLQTFFIGKSEYKIYPLDILLAGVFVGILVQYLLMRKKIQLRKVDWILMGFIGLNIVYFAWSLIIIKTNAALAFSALKNYAFYSLLYFATMFLFRDKKSWRELFGFFLAGAVALTGFVILGLISGEGLWSGYTPLSTSGVRKLAFTHGLYLTLAFFPMLLWLIGRKKIHQLKDEIYHVFMAIWLVGIIGALMRHLWIAMAGVFILLLLFLTKVQKKGILRIVFKLAVPFIVIGVFVFYAASMNPQSNLARTFEKSLGVVSERASSLVSSKEDESFAWRTLVWQGAYTRFKNNPIFGIGTGERIYVEDKDYKDFIEIRNIHNSYLAILFQLGFLGLGFFFFFVYGNVRALLSSSGDEQYNFYKFSILSVLAIYLLSLPFQPYLETNLLAIFFWMSLGLARMLPEIKLEK
jgi:O-antigen ligase